jgi:glycosyltransferase involved in cell wall biosynthesis
MNSVYGTTGQQAGLPNIAVMGLRGVPATWGGVEHQCEQLYSRLAAMGFDVTVYARKGYVDPNTISYKGMRIVCLPSVRSKHLEAIVHTFLAVIHASFSKADILHIYSQGPFLMSPLAKLLKPRSPIFFTCGGLDWQRKKWSRFASFVISLGERLSAKLADCIVVVSEALGNYYRERYGGEPVCIANGVDIPPFTPLDKVLDLEIARGGYFLFVGRLVPEKRIEDLIEAVKQLDQNQRLVVVGGSAGSEDYEARLRDAASSDPRIVFTGYRYGDELAALYSNALAYVTASELEGLPLTLLEAMSHKLPCLASDIPPHVEVLSPTLCRPFPVHDTKALADQMQKLLSSTEETKTELGESCLERVRKDYSWDRAAYLLGQAYRNVWNAK